MSDSVCAVVVTFNRRELLKRCLESLKPQIRPQDLVLVVDNASTDGTAKMLDEEFPNLCRLTLPANVGGAGAFFEGMKWGQEHSYNYLWLMDDDGAAAPDCLNKLLEQASDQMIAVPIQRDTGGRSYGISAWRSRNVDITSEILDDKSPLVGRYLFSFVGPLLPSSVVTAIGLPRADFFIWFDDAEYSLRIAEKTDIQVAAVPGAIFYHNMGENARTVKFLFLRSIRSDVSAWKLYYGVRNQLFTLLRRRGNIQELLLFGAVNTRLLLMDALYGPQRWTRICFRLRGTFDGVFGRLGKRV